MIFAKERRRLLGLLVTLRRVDRIVATWESRRAARWDTARAFCEESVINETAYSRWVNGIWVPNDATIEKVERALGDSAMYNPVKESGVDL